MTDFNLILSPNEKKRGRPCQPSQGLELSQFMGEAGVLDAGFSGSSFTWCNNRHGRARIWKRLDRLLLNNACLNDSTSMVVSHLVREPSDHGPLLLSFSTRLDNKSRTFRFLNVWTSKDSLLDVVKMVWQGDVSGSPFYRVRTKLKRVSHAI